MGGLVSDVALTLAWYARVKQKQNRYPIVIVSKEQRMVTGLSLENLAQVVHIDKERTFTQERLVRQFELTKGRADAAASAATWWTKIKHMTARPIVITLAVRPLRLTVQWA